MGFLLAFICAIPFALALSLGNSLSHDEHQHIAAGVLYAREGLIPYRDFAYFHVPYLVYVYGGLFSLSDHYLLMSRLFAAVCAAGTCGAIGWATWRAFHEKSWTFRIVATLGVVLIFLGSPVVGNTIGHSWNQEPSVFLILLAFLCHRAALDRSKPVVLLTVSGLLIGLAIGMRVTMAPVVLPFLVAIWMNQSTRGSRVSLLCIHAAGIGLALVPLVVAFASAPAPFVFDNIEFPQVNVTYRYSVGEPRTMTLLKKLRFLFKEVMRPDWVVFYGFVAACVLFAWHSRKRQLRWRPVMLVLLVLPFVLLGGLAPSPAFDQYFFPLVPFLMLGAVYLLASLPRETIGARWIWSVAVVVCLASGIRGAKKYEDIGELLTPHEWGVTELRDEALTLRKRIPQGKILTLAPSLMLEAGYDIYPAFATGPFAWRIAPFVASVRRRGLNIVGSEDLTAMLQGDRPVAVVTGEEDQGEKPLKNFAEGNRYQSTPYDNNSIIWVAP